MRKVKKRNKEYRPKPIHVPMMGATHDRLALKLHMSVEALIARPNADAYNAVTAKLATLSDAVSYMRGGRCLQNDRDAVANALRSALSVMTAVWDRWERTEKVFVSEPEAASLRQAVGGLDMEIARIPKNIFDASVALVHQAANKGRTA